MLLFSGCGHCKKAKPEFTEAAEEFKDDNKVLSQREVNGQINLREGTTVFTIDFFHKVSDIVNDEDFIFLDRLPLLLWIVQHTAASVQNMTSLVILHLNILTMAKMIRNIQAEERLVWFSSGLFLWDKFGK